MQQFREVSRTRTIYSIETHTSDFILNTFWNGKPVQLVFFSRGVEWWWRGANRTSLAAKFWIFGGGWMTELSVPTYGYPQWTVLVSIQQLLAYLDWTFMRSLISSSILSRLKMWLSSFCAAPVYNNSFKGSARPLLGGRDTLNNKIKPLITCLFK